MRSHTRTTISIDTSLLGEVDEEVRTSPELRSRSHLISTAVREFLQRRRALEVPIDRVTIEARIIGLDAQTILQWTELDRLYGDPSEAVRYIVHEYINQHIDDVNRRIHRRKSTCGEAVSVEPILNRLKKEE